MGKKPLNHHRHYGHDQAGDKQHHKLVKHNPVLQPARNITQRPTQLRFRFNVLTECGKIAKAFFMDCLPTVCEDVEKALKHVKPHQSSLHITKKNKYEYYIPKTHIKYYAQRYRMFYRFDQGCMLNKDGWFSITPEPIAIHLAQRCANRVVIDAFCGCGGNAIQFARYASHVIAIDNNLESLYIALLNARVYGVENNITFLYGDYCELIPRLTLFYPDVVHLSPPWGGIEYSDNDRTYDIVSHMYNLNGVELYRHSLNLTRNVIYYLPKNIDYKQLIALSTLTPCDCDYYTSKKHYPSSQPGVTGETRGEKDSGPVSVSVSASPPQLTPPDTASPQDEATSVTVSPLTSTMAFGCSTTDSERPIHNVHTDSTTTSTTAITTDTHDLSSYHHQLHHINQTSTIAHIFSDIRCPPEAVLAYPLTQLPSNPSSLEPTRVFCETYHQLRPVSSKPYVPSTSSQTPTTPPPARTTTDITSITSLIGEDEALLFYKPPSPSDLSLLEAVFLLIHRMEARVEFYVTKYHQVKQYHAKQQQQQQQHSNSADNSDPIVDDDEMPDILKPSSTTLATEYELIQAYNRYFSHGPHGNAPPPRKKGLRNNRKRQRSLGTGHDDCDAERDTTLSTGTSTDTSDGTTAIAAATPPQSSDQGASIVISQGSGEDTPPLTPATDNPPTPGELPTTTASPLFQSSHSSDTLFGATPEAQRAMVDQPQQQHGKASSRKRSKKGHGSGDQKDTRGQDPDYDFEIDNVSILIDFGGFDDDTVDAHSSAIGSSAIADDAHGGNQAVTNPTGDNPVSEDFLKALHHFIGQYACHRDYSKRMSEKKQVQCHFYGIYLKPRFHLGLALRADPQRQWLVAPGFSFAYQQTIYQEIMLLELLYRPLPTLAGGHWRGLKYASHAHSHSQSQSSSPPDTNNACPSMPQLDHNPSIAPSMYNIIYLTVARSSEKQFHHDVWHSYITEMEHLHAHFAQDNPHLMDIDPLLQLSRITSLSGSSASTTTTTTTTTTNATSSSSVADTTLDTDNLPSTQDKPSTTPSDTDSGAAVVADDTTTPPPPPPPVKKKLTTYQQQASFDRSNTMKTLILPTYTPYEFHQQAFTLGLACFIQFLINYHPSVFDDLIELIKHDSSTITTTPGQNKTKGKKTAPPQNPGHSRVAMSFTTALYMILSSSTYLASIYGDIMRLSELILGIVGKRFNVNASRRLFGVNDQTPSSHAQASTVVGETTACVQPTHTHHPIIQRQRQCVADVHLPYSRVKHIQSSLSSPSPSASASSHSHPISPSNGVSTIAPIEVELCALHTNVKAVCVYFGDLVQRFDTHPDLCKAPTPSPQPIQESEGGVGGQNQNQDHHVVDGTTSTTANVDQHDSRDGLPSIGSAHDPSLVDSDLQASQPMVTVNLWD